MGLGLMRKGMEIVSNISLGNNNTHENNMEGDIKGRNGISKDHLRNEIRNKTNVKKSVKESQSPDNISIASTYVVPQSFRLAFEVLVTVIINTCEKHGVDLEGVEGRDVIGMCKRMECKFEKGGR